MEWTGYNSWNSWIALVACSIITFFTSVTIRLAGLFFIIILDEYESSRTNVSIPIVTFGFIRSFMGPFIGYLAQKLGHRPVIIIGCILGAMGLGANYFAYGMMEIILYLGVIHGLGLAFSYTCIPTILRQHFDKNINFVFGICTAASTLVGLIMTPTVQYLKDSYGVREMFLIISGIFLHCLPAALFLKNPHNERLNPDHKDKRKVKNSTVKTLNNKEQGLNEHTNNSFVSDEKFVKQEDIINRKILVSDNNSDGICKTEYSTEHSGIYKFTYESDFKSERGKIKPAENFEKINYSLEENKMIEKLSQSMYTDLAKLTEKQSFGTQGSYLNTQINEIPSMINNEKESSKLIEKKGRQPCYIFELFTNPTFICIMMLESIHAFVSTIMLTIYIDLARDKNIPDDKSLYFVMFSPVASLIGMLSFGWITDHGFMTRVNFNCIGFLMMFFTYAFIFWSPSFELMIVAILTNSLVTSAVRNTFPGVIFEFIPREKQNMAIASRYVPYAFLCFVKSPLIGYVRETLGTYAWIFYVMMSCSLTCAILSKCIEFTATYWDKKRKQYEKMDNVNG